MSNVAQGTGYVGKRVPEIELGAEGEQRELGLGRTPGKVGARTGAKHGFEAAAARRVEGDDMVKATKELGIGRDLGPRGNRHAIRRKPRDDRLEPLSPTRNVRDRDQHGLAAAEEIPGHAGEALASPVDGLACTAPGVWVPDGAGARTASASARSSRSQKDPSSPSTRSSPGLVGHSARRITRGSTIPFHRFRSRRSAMSWLSSEAEASAFGGEPNATPRERAPPAVTSVNRACSPSSPMPVTC